MERIDLFVKKNIYYNLSSGKTGERWNMPMYNKDIKLWKGVDNKIQFSVRDHDRKAYPLRNDTLRLTLVNHILKTKIVKVLWCLDAYKGLYEVTFTKKDLLDFEPTHYQASISDTDPEGYEDNLYTGTDWNPIFNVEVIEGLKDTFIPSIEIDPSKFSDEYYIDGADQIDARISSRYDASLSKSKTASITVKDKFIGKIVMQGSLEPTPQNNCNCHTDWVDLASKEYTEEDWSEEKTEETIELTETDSNCLWVRFVITTTRNAEQGYVDSIIYRN